MAKPASMIMVGASGATGAYLYNNSDAVGDYMRDGTRGFLHSITAPRTSGSAPSQDMHQLQTMVTTLSRQVDILTQTQRNSHQIIVGASQPSTIMGVQVWKLVGLAGTAGVIYFKVRGYDFRDLVYVSKRHFNTVAENLKKQYESLDETVKCVREDLLRRLGLVETKVEDAKKSIEDKIDSEIGRVSGQIDGISVSVSKLDESLAQTTRDIKGVGVDVGHVKTELNRVADGIDKRLEKMHAEVEEIKDTAASSHHEMRREMGKIDGKIDTLSRSTQTTMNALQVGLDHTTKGINLLCEFVCQTQQPRTSTDSNTSDGSRKWFEELEEFTRTNRKEPSVIVRPAVPLVRRRTSGGLAGIKSITAN